MSKSLNEKLFLLQQEIGTISKDATNPFYKSKYFDINSLIKQLQPLLQEHRLLLLQPLKLPEMNDPQKLGSAITYYRRYTLGSLLGLQSVDDDANLASQAVTKTKKYLNAEHLSKDRFDKAIVAYKSDPEGVKENLRKFTLDQVQINILKQNKITL